MFEEFAAPHKAFCYTWSDIIGQCRSCEVSATVAVDRAASQTY